MAWRSVTNRSTENLYRIVQAARKCFTAKEHGGHSRACPRTATTRPSPKRDRPTLALVLSRASFPNLLPVVAVCNPKIHHIGTYNYAYINKMQIYSSCEIENFVVTHLSKLCVILRSVYVALFVARNRQIKDSAAVVYTVRPLLEGISYDLPSLEWNLQVTERQYTSTSSFYSITESPYIRSVLRLI